MKQFSRNLLFKNGVLPYFSNFIPVIPQRFLFGLHVTARDKIGEEKTQGSWCKTASLFFCALRSMVPLGASVQETDFVSNLLEEFHV